MNRFRALIGPGPLVLDGGWGTEFQRLGLAIGQIPDGWNLSRPDDVRAVARAYVEAGAGAILTNTFQSGPIALGRIGLEADVRRVILAGARLSREVAGDRLVFGSIGPPGRRPGGPAPGRSIAIQAEALAEGGVDAIVLETCLGLGEAREAAAAALEAGLPVVASFYFRDDGDGPTTLDGEPPERVAAAMADAGVDAVGANCGDGPAGFHEVCRRLAPSGLPIWMKPNAGLPDIHDGRPIYSADPEALAEEVASLIDAGASCVGGCCGTSPSFVAALRRRVDGGGEPREPHREASQT